jgi:hypothetical protein
MGQDDLSYVNMTAFEKRVPLVDSDGVINVVHMGSIPAAKFAKIVAIVESQE